MGLLEIPEENELLEGNLQDSEDIKGQNYFSFKHVNRDAKRLFTFSWDVET